MSASAICLPIGKIGLSEVIGSWKIIDYFVAAHLTHLLFRKRKQFPSCKPHLTLDAAGTLRQEPHDRK